MSYNIGAGGAVAAGQAGAILKGLNTVSIGALGQTSAESARLGNRMQINSQVNIGLTKAVGGFIVQVHTPTDYASIQNHPDYYIIPDTAEDFDKELGKIISLHLLKSTT